MNLHVLILHSYMEFQKGKFDVYLKFSSYSLLNICPKIILDETILIAYYLLIECHIVLYVVYSCSIYDLTFSFYFYHAKNTIKSSKFK